MTELYTITVIVSVMIIISFTLAGYVIGFSIKRFIGSIMLIFIGCSFSLWVFNNHVEKVILHDTTLLRYKMGIEGSKQHSNFADDFYGKNAEEQRKILYDIEHNINMDRAKFGFEHRMGFSDVSNDYLGAFIDIQRQLYLLPLIVPFLLIGAAAIGRWVQMEGAYGALRDIREETNKKKEESQEFDEQIVSKRKKTEQLQQKLERLRNDLNSKSDMEAEIAKLHQLFNEVKNRVTREERKAKKLTDMRNKIELDIMELNNEVKRNSNELKNKKEELKMLCKVINEKQFELEKKKYEVKSFENKEKVSNDIIDEFLR